MPSANVHERAPSADNTEPMKQTLTLMEHKIRNMEKRKLKLDSYKTEQEQGVRLNADQLLAVSKYGEVLSSLEFARDLFNQVNKIHVDTGRALKKEQKRVQLEKAAAEAVKTKQMLIYASVCQQLARPKVREDFAKGQNGAFVIDGEDLKAFDELSFSGLHLKKSTIAEQLDQAAERMLNLIDGKTKPVSSKTTKTFKELSEILATLTECDYFDPEKETVNEADVEVQETFEPPKSEEVLPALPAPTIGTSSDCAQILSEENIEYSFIQESQIDAESPHMDPAVVAVSSVPPPPINHHRASSAPAPGAPPPGHSSRPVLSGAVPPVANEILAAHLEHQQQQILNVQNQLMQRINSPPMHGSTLPQQVIMVSQHSQANLPGHTIMAQPILTQQPANHQSVGTQQPIVQHQSQQTVAQQQQLITNYTQTQARPQSQNHQYPHNMHIPRHDQQQIPTPILPGIQQAAVIQVSLHQNPGSGSPQPTVSHLQSMDTYGTQTTASRTQPRQSTTSQQSAREPVSSRSENSNVYSDGSSRPRTQNMQHGRPGPTGDAHEDYNNDNGDYDEWDATDHTSQDSMYDSNSETDRAAAATTGPGGDYFNRTLRLLGPGHMEAPNPDRATTAAYRRRILEGPPVRIGHAPNGGLLPRGGRTPASNGYNSRGSRPPGRWTGQGGSDYAYDSDIGYGYREEPYRQRGGRGTYNNRGGGNNGNGQYAPRHNGSGGGRGGNQRSYRGSGSNSGVNAY